jgi:hypothetical protein
MKLDRMFSKVRVARGIAISVTWFPKPFLPFETNLNGGNEGREKGTFYFLETAGWHR